MSLTVRFLVTIGVRIMGYADEVHAEVLKTLSR
jgi:hypothetical protein